LDRRNPTLANKIQSRILEEIHAGSLMPGDALEEVGLANRYQVSRTPVREALRQLASLGVVKITPRLGAVVADHSTETRKRETLEVIADLEGAAARYAATRMTPLQRESLLALREKMVVAVAADNRVLFDNLNEEFHKVIHRAAQNALLLDTIAGMRLRIVPYTRASHMSENARLRISHGEHEMLISALLKGDAEMAYHAMRFHVIQAGAQDEDLPAA
jgi:DNA-binding GntR family transcriptional regulator